MADFDETEVIRGSELRENADQAALKFLRGGYSRLVQTTAIITEKSDSMEVMLKEMQKTLSQLSNQLGKRPIAAESSHQPTPVTNSNPYVRDDPNRLPLDNRKSLFRKIEMPKFDGSNAYDWLSKVERFFSVRRYSDLDKLDLVALSLEGDVLKWFNWEMTRREFNSWEEFRRRLFSRFGAAPEESPGNRLFAIKQQDTVSAYVTESEELSSQVVGLDDSHLEQIVDNGLQTEIKVVLKLKESMGLENQKKSRCLKVSMFNFKRKKKRIKRWFNTLSCRESWRKHKHENLQIVSALLGFHGVYFRCHKEYGLARMINWSQVRAEDSLMQGKLFCFDGEKLPELDFYFSANHSQEMVCLSGTRSNLCGWLVFDRGKSNIISGDVITLVSSKELWMEILDGDIAKLLHSTRGKLQSYDYGLEITFLRRLRVHQQQQKRKFIKSWRFKYKSSFRKTRSESREMKFQLKHKWRSKHRHKFQQRKKLNLQLQAVLQAVLEQILQGDEEAYTKIFDKLQLNLKQGVDLHRASGHRLFPCQQSFSSIWHRWRRKDWDLEVQLRGRDLMFFPVQNNTSSTQHNSWMFSKDCVHLYPAFKLEDKLVFRRESIDTIHESYLMMTWQRLMCKWKLWNVKEALPFEHRENPNKKRKQSSFSDSCIL